MNWNLACVARFRATAYITNGSTSNFNQEQEKSFFTWKYFLLSKK
ncbi:hypothetical protein [Companilactobacillus huachuanensis]|nr:hypothetical protein [Companilactobacillus huachuanensis]